MKVLNLGMIKKFREMMDDDDAEILDIDSLMTDKDRIIYEKWLSIFNKLTPFNVPTGLDKVIADEDLKRSDEVILLSYLKFFEQRVFEMAKMNKKPKRRLDNESMYG